MAYTFKELKTIKDNIAAAYNIDTSAAARIVGYYNAGEHRDENTMQALLMGDLSSVPAAAAALGVKFSPRKDQGKEKIFGSKQKNEMEPVKDSGEKITGQKDPEKISEGTAKGSAKRPAKDSTTLLDCPRTNETLSAIETPNNSIETIQADIIPPHSLPSGLYDDIRASIEYYCQNEKIPDEKKIHPIEWKSVCIHIGQSLKARAILQDKARYKEVGFCYDGEKVAALLDIYEAICSYYRQVAFVYNFILFAGISRNYFGDYENRLTSGRVNLKEKAYEIQKASLVGAVTGGGSATVGNIFLSKALAGLQETVTIQHVSAASTPAAVALPVFGPDGGLLEDKRPE